MIKQHHIFFDLDGTLYDSKIDILMAWNNTYKYFNITGFKPEIGPSLDELLSKYNLKCDKQQIRAYFSNIYDNSKLKNTCLYNGIFEFLNRLKKHGYELNILTNKRTVPTNFLLKRDNIFNLFNVILTSDFNRKKYFKKDLFREYILQNKIDSANCIIFGDTQSDMDIAVYNKCNAIFCTWGYGKYEANEFLKLNLDDVCNLI